MPVWAAFNVSFPHHFLSASGAIAEQMKTREWIVARITSLTQNVADAKVSCRCVVRGLGSKAYIASCCTVGTHLEPLPASSGNEVHCSRGRDLEQ